jgi:penicillin amidase
MARTIRALVAFALISAQAASQDPQKGAPSVLAGLQGAAEITRDAFGIAHVRAGNDHDLYFMQGYVHAKDRLFQMDVSRRIASGTLAELLGPTALAGDVELRTIGMRRAAARSLKVISSTSVAALEAYAEGVNAYVTAASLPVEYQALELSKFEPWTALDSMSVAKSIAFALSFSLEDINNTVALQTYTAVFDSALGSGTGRTLFAEDLWRAQPFFAASTVPDASLGSGGALPHAGEWAARADAVGVELAKKYADRVRNLPFFKNRMERDNRPGSNEWAVSGRYTASGRPLVANDPHGVLGEPSSLYPIHLMAGDTDAMGSGFAGVPFVIVGQTASIAWGTTQSPLDVTDVFQEQVVPDPVSPSGLSTIYRGLREPVISIPEAYQVNNVGDGVRDNLSAAPSGGTIPAATLIVPRRNNGPIVQLDPATGVAISVEYTGFSGTREADSFWTLNRARNLDDLMRALQWYDSGTQNFAYADVDGNIAYFAASEVPLREDLQNGIVVGLPPWFIRDGTGGNEWLPVQHPQPGQAIPYEILPASEMPHLVNPPAGWFVNANNDPAGLLLDNDPLNAFRPGGGLYYLSGGYDAGLRAGRITELLKAKISEGAVSFGDMQSIQADVVLPDAQIFVPHIVQALQRATRSSNLLLASLASQPGVREAVRRFAAWRLTAPTGIPGGYDANDTNGVLAAPTSEEIDESVAATIYSVWRGQFIRNTIDATLEAVPLPPRITLPKPGEQLSLTALKNLLERPRPGIGASGLNFFNAPAASSEDRRDIVILASLAGALGRLADSEFGPAFSGSTNQADYRWGKLHRIVLRHPLSGPFNIPPAFGAFANPLGDALPGFPVDGGFWTVDASKHDPRAQSVNDFMFDRSADDRFVAEAAARGVRSESAWPGGTSGVPGDSFYVNLLPGYLTNNAIPLLFRNADVQNALHSSRKFVPARP